MAKINTPTLIYAAFFLAASGFVGCQTDAFRTSGTVVSSQTGDAATDDITLQWPGHNLQLDLNPEEWRTIKRPERYDPDSSGHQELLSLKHRESGYYFTVTAASPGFDLLRTMEEIYQHQKEIGDYEVNSKTYRELNGIPYMVLQERNTETGSRAIQYLSAYQGMAIRTWTSSENSAEPDYEHLQQFADRFNAKLKLIDPDRAYFSKNAKVIETHDSPYGYRFHSPRVPYVQLDSPWDPPSLAELFVRVPPQGSTLSVIPFKLPDSNLRIDALAHAISFAINQNFVQQSNAEHHRIQSHPYPISEYRMRQESQDSNLYRVYRIVRTADSAILMLKVMQSDRMDTAFDNIASHFDFDPEDFSAPEREADPEREAKEARFLAGLGNYFVQRGNARRGLDYLSQAYEVSQDNEEILTLYASGLSMNQRFEVLRDLMTEARPSFPDNRLIDRFLGLALYQTGEPEAAGEAYRKLFDSGFMVDVLIDEHFNGMIEAGMAPIALDEARTLMQAHRNPRISLWYGIALARSGEVDEAIEHLKTLPSEAMADTAVGGTLLNLKLEQQQFAEAIALAELLFEETGNAEYLLHQGVGLIALNQYMPAQELIQEAIRINPAHPHARGLLNHVETLLGHSDPSLYNDPIDPVALDPKLKSMIAAHADVEPAAYGAVMSYIGAAIAFERDQGYRRSEYRRVYVQSETLLTGFKGFHVTFNPLHESVYVNTLKVYDAEGKLVAEGDPRSYYLSDRGADNVIDQSRTLHITIPGLTVGGSYELLFTRKSNYTKSLPSIHYCFTGQIPRNLSFFQLTSAEGEVRHHISSDQILEFENGDTRFWTIEHPQTIERHSHLPHYRTYMPSIWFGDAQIENWETPAKEYLDEIASQLNEPCTAVQEVIEGLGLADDATIEDKVAAVSEYIQRNFTYMALSFGMRARIPREPAAILNNRYGDCKDLSILAVRMLREMDIEAYPALVRTSMDFVVELPNLDQFDHMIVFIPQHYTAPLYDPADSHMGSQASARTVGQTPVLVLNENPFLHTPDTYNPEQGLVEIDRKVKVNESGDLQITELVVLHGYSAAHARGLFMGQPDRNHPVVLQGILRHGGKNPFVNKLEITGLERRNEPLKLEYSYQLSNYWTPEADQSLRGRIPSSWEQYFFFLERFPTERVGPVYIHNPAAIHAQTTLHTPEGWSCDPSRQLSSESHQFALGSFLRKQQLKEDGSFSMLVQAQLNQGLEPVESYPDFESFMDSVRRHSEPNWIVRAQP